MRNNVVVFFEVRGMFYVGLARNNVGNKRYVCNAMLCYMPNAEGTHILIQIIIFIILLYKKKTNSFAMSE